MPIPTHEDVMLPVLAALADGQPHQRRTLSDDMAYHFGLTVEERAARVPSGKFSVIASRTGWALSYLKQAGLVQSTRRGWYAVTNRGRQTLAEKPQRIDNGYLERFPEFQEFRARTREEQGANVPGSPD